MKKDITTIPDLQQIALYPLVVEINQKHLITQSVETLLAISHSIENVVMESRLKGTFYAGFQRFSAFLPQLNRFARLASICGEVLIFGYDDVPVPELPGVTLVPLAKDAPLTSEWFIIFSHPQFTTALFTHQMNGDSNDDSLDKSSNVHFGRGRYYHGTVTFSTSLVLTARNTLDKALQRSPAQDQTQIETWHDVPTSFFSFNMHMVQYLEKRNQELSSLYHTLANRTEMLQRTQNMVKTLLSRTAWEQVKEHGDAFKDNDSILEPQNLTILFTDIQGFTSLSERIPPPKLIEALNQYFDILATTVYQNQGDVDKFLGDGMFAFFKSPHRALQTALSILQRVKIYNKQKIAHLNFTFITRIGLVTGPCLIARIGSRARKEVTILGDTVNTASRLQAYAPPEGLIMNEATYLACEEPPAIPITVKPRGKQAVITVYEANMEELPAIQDHLAALKVA